MTFKPKKIEWIYSKGVIYGEINNKRIFTLYPIENACYTICSPFLNYSDTWDSSMKSSHAKKHCEDVLMNKIFHSLFDEVEKI